MFVSREQSDFHWMELCELSYLGLLLKFVNIPVLVKIGQKEGCFAWRLTYISDLMILVFTMVLCDIHTEDIGTVFISETGFLFCEAQAEAEETVEHLESFIINVEYL
jgi:hypothetical protein